MFDKHEEKHSLRAKIRGLVCECCLQFWHIKERLVRHVLHTSPKCKQYYSNFAEVVPAEILKEEEKISAAETKKCFQRFLGPQCTPGHVFTDNSKEFEKALEDLQLIHDTSIPYIAVRMA